MSEWKSEATRLRETGMGFLAIAQAVGRSESTVREHLNENGERERKVLRNKLRNVGETMSVTAYAKRETRQILVDPDTKRKAVEAFTAGKISRATMIQRITAGKPDTSAELARAGVR